MKIGDLRHRITISDSQIFEDEWGNQIRDWIEIAQVWARVSNLYGTEYFAAAAIQLEKMLLFTIRYLPSLTESMMISFQGKDYDIKFVDNIKYRNEFLEIKALLKNR